MYILGNFVQTLLIFIFFTEDKILMFFWFFLIVHLVKAILHCLFEDNSKIRIELKKKWNFFKMSIPQKE